MDVGLPWIHDQQPLAYEHVSTCFTLQARLTVPVIGDSKTTNT